MNTFPLKLTYNSIWWKDLTSKQFLVYLLSEIAGQDSRSKLHLYKYLSSWKFYFDCDDDLLLIYSFWWLKMVHFLFPWCVTLPSCARWNKLNFRFQGNTRIGIIAVNVMQMLLLSSREFLICFLGKLIVFVNGWKQTHVARCVPIRPIVQFIQWIF